RHTELRQQQQHDEGDEGTDHEDFAVGEVDHADDAVDHRVADGDEAINGAEGEPVDELVHEIAHGVPPALYSLLRAVTTLIADDAFARDRSVRLTDIACACDRVPP